MGKKSRTKGRAFEQKIARELRAIWPDAVVRRASQAERADNPDVSVEGGPAILGRLWLELQDAAQPTPLAKLDQAHHDSREWNRKRPSEPLRLPVVIWHRLGERVTRATMELWVLDLIRGIYDSHKNQLRVATFDLDDFLTILRDHAAQEAA